MAILLGFSAGDDPVPAVRLDTVRPLKLAQQLSVGDASEGSQDFIVSPSDRVTMPDHHSLPRFI